MKECIFCQIINGKVPAQIVLEEPDFIAIKDINPKAPVHILIIPKKHLQRPSQIEGQILQEMLIAADKIAQEQKISSSGFRLSFNVGSDAGQVIEHVHLHLLGGTPSHCLY